MALEKGTRRSSVPCWMSIGVLVWAMPLMGAVLLLFPLGKRAIAGDTRFVLLALGTAGPVDQTAGKGPAGSGALGRRACSP